MINGDIIQVTFHGLILGQKWNMVQHYKANGLDANGMAPEYFLGMLEDLYNTTRGHWATYVTGSMSTQMSLRGARGDNLFSLVEFGEHIDPSPLSGAVATDPMPSFTAARMRSPTKRKGMRSASKFIPGIVESLVTNGSTITQANLNALNNFASNFGANQFFTAAPLVVGNLRPVCVQRIFEGVVNGKRRYRLPANQGEAVTYDTDNYTFLTEVTTMNSRKAGRGI